MSDNLRRYRAIHQALKQGYPEEPSGHMARHLITLAVSFIGAITPSRETAIDTAS